MKFREQVLECRKIYCNIYMFRKLKQEAKLWIDYYGIYPERDGGKIDYQHHWKNMRWQLYHEKINLQQYNIVARIWAKITWRI